MVGCYKKLINIYFVKCYNNLATSRAQTLDSCSLQRLEDKKEHDDVPLFSQKPVIDFIIPI
jgi:hypothetical protein